MAVIQIETYEQEWDVGEIQSDHDYFYDKYAVCPPAPSPVEVPGVALHLDVKDDDSEDGMMEELWNLNIQPSNCIVVNAGHLYTSLMPKKICVIPIQEI